MTDPDSVDSANSRTCLCRDLPTTKVPGRCAQQFARHPLCALAAQAAFRVFVPLPCGVVLSALSYNTPNGFDPVFVTLLHSTAARRRGCSRIFPLGYYPPDTLTG